jgi:hypothetical protein
MQRLRRLMVIIFEKSLHPGDMELGFSGGPRNRAWELLQTLKLLSDYYPRIPSKMDNLIVKYTLNTRLAI